MRAGRLVVALLASVAVPADGVASCETTEDCLARIEAAQKEAGAWQARFEQVKETPLLDEPIVTRGRMSFDPPDRVVWEVEEPEPQRIVLGKSEGGADAPPELARAGEALVSLLRGDASVLEGQADVVARPVGEDIEVVVDPTDPALAAHLENLWLRFAGPKLRVEEIRMSDPLGDSLTIRLSPTEPDS